MKKQFPSISWTLPVLLCLAIIPCSAEVAGRDRSDANSPATLTVWGRDLVTFRGSSSGITPADRIQAAKERIAAIPDSLLDAKITTRPVSFDGHEGVAFLLGPVVLFGLYDADLDVVSGETLDVAVARTLRELKKLQEAWQTQQRPVVLLRGILVSLIIVGSLAGVLWLLSYLRARFRSMLVHRVAGLRALKMRALDLRGVLLKMLRPLLDLLFALAACVGIVYAVENVLFQFPRTVPWAEVLRLRVVSLTTLLLDAFLTALPKLFMVVVIFLTTRWAVRLLRAVFQNFELDSSQEFSGDSARATGRLVVVLTWVAGCMIAYPFIPGSGSTAFKGIGVLIGLMLSLGSTGVINQIMSGFVTLYSGAVRSGEYARVGNVEGTVSEIGFLATKIRTPMNEYITVPNSLLVSDRTINYSRLQDGERTKLSVEVGIGYATPWRQVQALLLLAAERTPGIRNDPLPVVRQVSLADFYIQYALQFVPGDERKKASLLSDLQARILDTFNEFGVQIMSPHYVSDPPNAQVVPRENWTPPPVVDQPRPGRNKSDGTH